MSVIVSGYGQPNFKTQLDRHLSGAQPAVLGLASAFVSAGAVLWLIDLIENLGSQEVRMVAGLDHAITHPNALRLAKEAGWEIRTSARDSGIFHPKLLVGGESWDTSEIENEGICVVGSANLTIPGLERNIEANVVSRDQLIVHEAFEGFQSIWEASTELTDEALTNYAAHFAERSRDRRPSELKSLGVEDTAEGSVAAVDVEFATLVWIGLESFTGEHTLQVEIPRDPAAVLRRIVAGRLGPEGELDVFCEADASAREMKLRFYEDNQMVRLNIPNDVPDVDWVREEHRGLLVLSRGPEGGAALRLNILRPGPEANELQDRSGILGTWGNTSTRFFGWQ